MSLSTLVIASVNYTAYADESEADPYLVVDPVRAAAWAALASDERKSRLVSGTRQLDQLKWLGEKTGGAAQVNAFPRTGLTYPDGTAVSTTEVPVEVEIANILLAGDIAIKAKNAEPATSGSNVRKVKAGSAEVEFFRPTDGVALKNEAAFNLVSPFLAGQSGSAALGIFAGGCTTTVFPTSPGLNKGLG